MHIAAAPGMPMPTNASRSVDEVAIDITEESRRMLDRLGLEALIARARTSTRVAGLSGSSDAAAKVSRDDSRRGHRDQSIRVVHTPGASSDSDGGEPEEARFWDREACFWSREEELLVKRTRNWHTHGHTRAQKRRIIDFIPPCKTDGGCSGRAGAPSQGQVDAGIHLLGRGSEQ